MGTCPQVPTEQDASSLRLSSKVFIQGKVGNKLSFEILRGVVGWRSQKPQQPRLNFLLATNQIVSWRVLSFDDLKNPKIIIISENWYLFSKHKLFKIFTKPLLAQAYYQIEIESTGQIKLAYSNWLSYHSYAFSNNFKILYDKQFILFFAF